MSCAMKMTEDKHISYLDQRINELCEDENLKIRFEFGLVPKEVKDLLASFEKKKNEKRKKRYARRKY
jgi:hypothetical protein